MEEVLTEFEDEEGNAYLVLAEDDDGSDDLRNARRRVPPSRRRGSRGRVVPVRRGGHSVPPPRSRSSSQAHHRPPSVQVLRTSQPSQPDTDTVTFKVGKVGEFLEVLGEGVAEMIPLPDKPPAATGQDEIDYENQNEHRHALHAHRVLTNRIRTAGRLGNKLLNLLIEG